MTLRSRRPESVSDARAMLPVLACLLVVAAAAPILDQHQEGELNVRADVQNVLFLIAFPQKMSSNLPLGLLDLLKNAKQGSADVAQDRSDVRVMEAFVEPSTPYRVEIGSERERSAGGGARDIEVVIAGRRRLEAEPLLQDDEMKLIGATEQCGPGRARDPVSLTCRDRDDPALDRTPEVVPATPV